MSDQALIAEAITRENELLSQLLIEFRALRPSLDALTDALYHHAGGRP